jgi:hypothetical protein
VVVGEHPDYPRWIKALGDIGISLAAFGVVAALAALLGAANTGTAFGVGQVAFVIAACFVMLRG